ALDFTLFSRSAILEILMDPAIKAKAQNLIKSGLYETNLRELLQLVEQHFFQRPALYGSLISLLQALIDEFSSGHISAARLKHIEQNLTQPMLDALAAESAPPQTLLNALNALHTAWYNL
ncbi:MAG: hypothetical protein WCA22_19545, partial [Candidatus Binatus sp.]